MDRREVALAAPAAASPPRLPTAIERTESPRRQRRRHQVEPDAVAADDYEVRYPHMRREQRDLGIGAGRHLIGERIDRKKTVSLRERSQAPEPLPVDRRPGRHRPRPATP